MKRLSDLDVGEISFVPEGANKRKFLIYKSKGGTVAQPSTALQKLISSADPEVMKKVEKVLNDHMAPGKPAAPAAPAPAAAPHPSAPPAQAPVAAAVAAPAPTAPVDPAGGISPEEVEQAKHALKAIVRIVTPWKDKLSPIMLHEVLDAAGFEVASGGDGGEPTEPAAPVGKDQGAMNVGDGTPVHDAGASKKDPAVEAAVGKGKAIPMKVESEEHDVLKGMGIPPEHMEEAKKEASAAYKAKMEKLGHRMYPDAEMQMKSVHKTKEETEGGSDVSKTAVVKSADGTLDLSGVPEAARPVVEAIYKGQQEAVRKAAELEGKLAQRDAADRKRELVQKAAGWTHLGLKQDEVVATLEDAAKSSPEALERVTKQYDTLNAQAKNSHLFSEFGSNQGSSGKGDAEAKIDAAVEQIVQKSAGGVSREQAYEQFVRSPEGQKLYAEYKTTRKDGI